MEVGMTYHITGSNGSDNWEAVATFTGWDGEDLVFELEDGSPYRLTKERLAECEVVPFDDDFNFEWETFETYVASDSLAAKQVEARQRARVIELRAHIA